jgi:hypothetical protein
VILASEKGAIFAYTGMPVNVRKYGKTCKRKLNKTKTAAQKRKWEGTVYGYGLKRTKKKK